jgi:hypothetical protein
MIKDAIDRKKNILAWSYFATKAPKHEGSKYLVPSCLRGKKGGKIKESQVSG